MSGCKEPIIKMKSENYSTNPMLNHLKNVHKLFPLNAEGDQKKPRIENQISKNEQDKIDSLLYVLYCIPRRDLLVVFLLHPVILLST